MYRAYGTLDDVNQATLKLGESVTVSSPLLSVNGKYRLEMFQSESIAFVLRLQSDAPHASRAERPDNERCACEQ